MFFISSLTCTNLNMEILIGWCWIMSLWTNILSPVSIINNHWIKIAETLSKERCVAIKLDHKRLDKSLSVNPYLHLKSILFEVCFSGNVIIFVTSYYQMIWHREHRSSIWPYFQFNSPYNNLFITTWIKFVACFELPYMIQL